MTYTKYEWTAFTEADLLANGKNGNDFGCGDTFVMPGKATVTMSTMDNDGALSGGAYNWWTWKTESADRTGQDATVNGARVGCKMYADQYHVLKGSDGKTYYLIDIKVEGYDTPGAGNGYFSFYGATPPAGVNLTVVQTCSASGLCISYDCLGAGNTAPPNTPPTFTNIPSDGVFCVNENTKLVIDIDAYDKDGDALTFSIIGGDDAGKFVIDPKTGVLNFITAPDYEAPGDKDGNNSYKVIVAVSDGKGGVTNKALTVNVCDVDDSPKPVCTVIEAEDMTLCGYTVKCATSASGGQYVSLTGYNGWMQTTFKGAAGEYDLNLRHYDQAGSGSIKVYVNGTLVKTISLNLDNNKWNDASINSINLKTGDVIKITTSGTGCEFALIDQLKICPTPPKTGALEGRVFFDANKNGIDDSEAGVAGVTVQLLDSTGRVVGTTMTAPDGSYKFSNLAPGNYKVAFPTTVNGKVLTAQDVGSNDTIDSDANVTTGLTGPNTVVAGQTTSDVDAGFKDPGNASLSGRIFVDVNKNDVDDSEPGVGGVTVKLLNAAGVVIATTVTAANGSYSFGGLDAGTYQVQFPTEVNGKTLVNQDVGGDDSIDSDADQGTGKTDPITVGIGEHRPDNDAGFSDPGTAAIGNLVWIDSDRDGIQDAGEAGKEGVTVTLYDASGNAIATTVTDADGKYLFTGLDAGTYSVGFGEPAGYDFTIPGAGSNPALDSNANPATGRTAPVTLTIGEANLTIDAGLVRENKAPVAVDDKAGTCSDVIATVNVLANDSDADGDSLTITSVAGQTIVEGQTITTATGVKVTLSGGQLVVDGVSAYDALDIGQKAVEAISYTISDGYGGTASAKLNMSFCGTANSVESLVNSLPNGPITYQIQASNVVAPVEDYAYNVKLVTTGDARLDGDIFTAAYCLDRGDPFLRGESFATAPVVTGTLIGANEAAAASVFDADQFSFFNGLHASQNLDLVTWIMNQDFTNDASGRFNDWEVQRAIWELTNKDDLSGLDALSPGFGQDADVDYILAQAAANGEGFVAGVGDIIGVIVDPGNSDPNNLQPFIIGMKFQDYDCLCA